MLCCFFMQMMWSVLCTYASALTHTHTCTYTHIHRHTHTHTQASIGTRKLWLFVCVCVCVCVWAFINVLMFFQCIDVIIQKCSETISMLRLHFKQYIDWLILWYYIQMQPLSHWEVNANYNLTAVTILSHKPCVFLISPTPPIAPVCTSANALWLATLTVCAISLNSIIKLHRLSAHNGIFLKAHCVVLYPMLKLS